MNAQHLSETGEWYTPPEEIERVHRVFPSGFFDPCSSERANQVVRATTWSDRGLDYQTWGGAAFVNPPGACPKAGGIYSVCGNKGRCSCKLPSRFLERSLVEAHRGCSVLFLSYSVNHVRLMANLLQEWRTRDFEVMGAIPLARIPYLVPETLEPQKGTNCDSLYWLMSRDQQTIDRFGETFADRQLFAMG